MLLYNNRLMNSVKIASMFLAVFCSAAWAESAAPNSTDPTEVYRVNYTDIGYPDIGFSPFIKGWVNGYLTPDDYPDGKVVLPPPPEKGSPAYEADLAAFQAYQTIRNTSRGQEAVADANLKYENIGKPFSDALGIDISRKNTPHLHLLLSRVLTDAAYASDSAKAAFKRTRPFTELKVASCTPEHEASLSTNGSYPSGHAVTGLLWGMVLTSIAPEQATPLMKKAYDFGEGRALCGVHWESDVEAGRILASGAFARLQASDEYRKQAAEAKTEIDNLRKVR